MSNLYHYLCGKEGELNLTFGEHARFGRNRFVIVQFLLVL